jgi:hypothetical protein
MRCFGIPVSLDWYLGRLERTSLIYTQLLMVLPIINIVLGLTALAIAIMTFISPI